MLRKKFIIPMVAIMSVASSGSVFASEKAVDDNKVIYREAEVTAKSGLNVRETPAIEKDNKIFAVPIGTELDIIDKENDWFKVKLDNNKEAYINSNYVKVNHNDLYVNVDRLNFREAPGTDKKIYDVLTKGTKIQFLEESGDWVKVKVNNTTGYVHSNYINNEKPVVEENNKTETTTSKKEENTTSTVKPNKDVEDKADKNESKKEQANESKTEVSKEESTNKEEAKKPSVQKEESKETSKKEESTSSQSKPSTSKPSTSKPSESKPSTSKPAEDTNKEESEKPSSSKNVQAVIDLAYAQIGKPYNWGSEGPKSFDCSGLMRYIFQNGADINLPRTSKAQSQYGTTVSRSNLKPGDLIFSSTDGSGTVSHVGIYIGGGQMIHAPKPGDVVKVSSINSSYWNDVYLWAKRVM